MNTILVTGGAGFIGSHLIQALQRADLVVVNIDEVNDYYNPAFKRENIALLEPHPLYQIDITDAAALENVFQSHRIDLVVHLAARAGIRASFKNPELYHRVNVLGTKMLLEMVGRYNVPRFIFGSSSSVYGNTTALPFVESEINFTPISPYGQSKLEAENLVQEYQQRFGFQATILRFFTVYGERGRPDMAPYLFTEALFKGRSVRKFGDGTSSRDYTYSTDTVAGIMTAIERPFPFEIINLGNNHAVSLNEFIAMLEEVTGKTAVVELMPAQVGDVTHTLADIKKAERLLDYRPSTPLRVGLERFVEWYRAHRL